jgi:hypothetical protein
MEPPAGSLIGDGFLTGTLIYIGSRQLLTDRRGSTLRTQYLPENNRKDEEETEMGSRREQLLMRQKASFELTLKERLSYLSGKGIEAPKARKDTIVRKLQADVRAMNKRLKAIADNDKRTEEMARAKAEQAAAPRKEQESGKSEKPKKASEEGKGKKTKPEGGKSQRTAESPGAGKPATKQKAGEKKGEPAGPAKTSE